MSTADSLARIQGALVRERDAITSAWARAAFDRVLDVLDEEARNPAPRGEGPATRGAVGVPEVWRVEVSGTDDSRAREITVEVGTAELGRGYRWEPIETFLFRLATPSAPTPAGEVRSTRSWTSRELGDRNAADRMEYWHDRNPGCDQFDEDLDRLIVSARHGRRQSAPVQAAGGTS